MPKLRYIVTSIAAALAVEGAAAQPAETFYAGKTVRILIGFDVGGQYGQFARLAATHLRQHIPANPSLIVQSMPGASGITAMNYLTNVAPQDGTTLALVTVGVIQEGLLESPAKFDPRQLRWIGRMASVMQIGIAATSSGIRSLDDAKARPFVAGGIGANSLPTLNFRLANEMAGTRFKLVTGYKGTAEMHLAMERGEIHAYNNAWDFVQDRHLPDVVSGKIAIIFVNGLRKVPELARVPNLADFARSDVERSFMRIYSAGTEIGRSLVAPPGIPLERLATLRAAFAAMLADAAFRADAAAQSIRVEPMEGAQLAAFADDVLGMPAATVAAARGFYAKVLDEPKP